MKSLAIAATGMNAQQTNIEVIANNIANINSTSYKRARAEFTDLFYQMDRMTFYVMAPTFDRAWETGVQPLMPVLEAVGRLARGAHATRVVKLLRDHAPAWLIQMP